MTSKHLTLRWTAWLRGLMLLAACAVGPAQAAIYTGVWDPTYGFPFTNLGWRGSAGFSVPNGCKPPGTVDIDNDVDCGGLAAVTNAKVEFYDISQVGQPTLSTVVFTPSATELDISTLRFVSGALTELIATFSDSQTTGISLAAFGVLPSTQFSLEFTLGGPRLRWVDCAVSEGCSGLNDADFPPKFTITQVPEPTTLWLGGLALLVLVRVRRFEQARRP
jgi:hypothetical protein